MSKQTKPRCRLRERKTKFVEIFRTTPTATVCPNFYVLSHANGCAFSPRCAYCYLKSSFWFLKEDVAFSNVDKMLREVRRWIRKDGLESYVLNMGNLSDSLAFEGMRPILPALVEVMREAEREGRPHALLLVTKGGAKDAANLLRIEPCVNVIVSFSVNIPHAARRYERGAAAVADRLDAARRLQRRGWRIRIRIDPMIVGYDYTWIIERVRALRPERVTLGTLRAEPNLDRWTEKGLFKDLVRPDDPNALARYPRDQRMALYRQAVKRLRGICPIGLCEETYDVWKDLGLKPEEKSCNCGS